MKKLLQGFGIRLCTPLGPVTPVLALWHRLEWEEGGCSVQNNCEVAGAFCWTGVSSQEQFCSRESAWVLASKTLLRALLVKKGGEGDREKRVLHQKCWRWRTLLPHCIEAALSFCSLGVFSATKLTLQLETRCICRNSHTSPHPECYSAKRDICKFSSHIFYFNFWGERGRKSIHFYLYNI